MKKFLNLLLVIMPLYANAQWFHVNDARGRKWGDRLSLSNLKKIKTANADMTKEFVLYQALPVDQMTKMLSHEYTTLNKIHDEFKGSQRSLNRFISITCQIFINSKYPLMQLNPLNGLQMNPIRGVQNRITRGLFSRKFISEAQALDVYLNANNAISEAKRVYFVLDILENVTNIALENEEY